MASYKDGILGPFSGKVGPITGASWKGRPYIKSNNSLPQLPATTKQQHQRSKFGVASRWLRPMRPWIELGYRHAPESTLPMNAAISFFIRYVVIGTAPNFAIDYPQVVWTRGELLASVLTHFEWTATGQPGMGQLHIEWLDALPSFYNQTTDNAIFVLYSVGIAEFAVFDEGAVRGDGNAVLVLPQSFAAGGLHAWMFYRRGDSVSTSVYCGAHS